MQLPFAYSVAGVRGAAMGTAIPVGGINAVDTLLAVIEHDAGTGFIAGRDPAAFTVSDGEIESATLDTSGHYLKLIYLRG